MLLLILVKPFSSFTLPVSFFFRDYKIARQSRRQIDVLCAFKIFLQRWIFRPTKRSLTENSTLEENSSPKMVSVPNIVPASSRRYQEGSKNFGMRLHFHHFETSLLVLLKCKHPKNENDRTNGSKKFNLGLTSVL